MDTTGTGEAYARWYQGPAQQSFVSGLPNGVVHVRIRGRAAKDGSWSAWSTPTRIRIQHPSLTKAFTLLGIGLFVFVVIAGYVGYMSTREQRAVA